MAQAVKELYPQVKVAIGPSIEDGFYYDFDKSDPFVPEDLKKIEAKMKEIIKKDLPFEQEQWDKDKALKYFENHQETYKLELIEALGDEKVFIYICYTVNY